MTTYQILWICTLIFFISIHLTFCLFSTLLSSLFSWVYKSYKSKSRLFIINDFNITYFSKLRKNTFKLRYIPRVWKIFNKKLIISFISLVISTLIWFWFLIRGRYGILLCNRRRHNIHRHNKHNAHTYTTYIHANIHTWHTYNKAHSYLVYIHTIHT